MSADQPGLDNNRSCSTRSNLLGINRSIKNISCRSINKIFVVDRINTNSRCSSSSIMLPEVECAVLLVRIAPSSSPLKHKLNNSYQTHDGHSSWLPHRFRACRCMNIELYIFMSLIKRRLLSIHINWTINILSFNKSNSIISAK